MNKQRYGIVVGFVDKGNKLGRIYPYFVPPIPDKHKEMGFDYAHPEVVKEGVNFGELEDIKQIKRLNDKIVFLGKRFQPYENLNTKIFIDIAGKRFCYI